MLLFKRVDLIKAKPLIDSLYGTDRPQNLSHFYRQDHLLAFQFYGKTHAEA